MNKEREVEILLNNWFKEKSKCIQEVYFNSINEINAPIFKVRGVTKEIPDIILSCVLFGKKEYIAIEVKDASRGSNVISGCKIFSKYLKNYINKKTEYFIGETKIPISRFVVATQYSPEGKLFESNDMPVENGSGKPSDSWINHNVPFLEYNRTKDFNRHNINEYSEYRKKNKIKEAPGIGVIVSDILTTFDLKELEKQSGMKGNPLFQGVVYNDNRGKWQQCLTEL